jgi:choline-sulfatase
LSRRRHLAVAALLPLAGVALGLFTAAGCRPAAQKPRNLLVVTIDTLRADAVGAYGKSPSPTPNLDRLAREGALLRRVQSHVPLTLPSHATLFTGKLPFETGVRNNGTYALPESAETLAETLAAQGFDTGAAVASYVLARKFGLAQGFATYDDALGSGGGAVRALRAEIPAEQVYRKWRSWLDRRPAAGKNRGKDGAHPFFYWAHFYDPHQPYEPPAEDRARAGGDAYAGEVAYVDRQVGRMLEDLEKAGLLADTLVVVTSDHGEGFGEHGEWGHGLLTYQESLAVPLLLRGPGIAAGRAVEARAGLADLLPSLLEVFGIAPPAGFAGQSFLAKLQDPAPADASGAAVGERTFYFESLLGQEDRNWAPITGLLRGEDKLIAVPKAELYDLAADPGEKQNRLDSERRLWRELDEQLRALLLGKTAAGAGRAADEQDLAALRSLGYVSSGGAGGTVLDPKDGVALDAKLKLVETAIAEGRLDQARQDLAAAREAWPGAQQPAFYLLERQLLEAGGDPDGALAALRSGVARLPEVFPLRFELLRQLYGRQRHAELVEEGQKLLAKQPDSAQVLALVAMSRVELGQLDAALVDFEKARRADPGNADLEAEMAGALVRAGRVDEALAIHGKLADAGAYEGQAKRFFDAAMVFARAGDRGRALELFDRGLALEPNGFFLLTSALLLAQENRLDEAAERMRQALAGGGLTPEQQQLGRQALQAWGRG